MKLSAKQAKFCQEYLKDLNVLEAMIASGYQLKKDPGSGYFVYLLCHPETNTIFYVGKGKGKRPYQHFKSRDHLSANARKQKIVLEIIKSGGEVQIFYFETDIVETTAYKIEKELIKAFKSSISNIQSGRGFQTIQEWADYKLSKLKNLSTVCRENRPAYELELYFKIVSELKKMAI